MTTFATTVWPVPNRFIGFGKEPAGTSGNAVMPTFTYPMNKFDPVDKYTFLEDDAWRHAMAGLYNLIQGVRIADISLGGPLFADGIGYQLAGILGDYWQSVTGTVGTTTTTNGALAIGATTATLTSATGFSSSTVFALGTLGTQAEAVRQATNLAGSVISWSVPLYQAYPSGAPVTGYTTVTTVTHNFSLLNGTGAGMGGYAAAQPPTYSLLDYTGPPATTGARIYSFGVPSEVSLTGTSTALVEWEAKYIALASVIAGTAPTSSPSTVVPQASWRSTVSLAGAQVYNDVEWKLTLTRKAEPVFTNSNQQDPFSIPRGALTAMVGLNFNPAQDESEFLYYLNNTQPTLSIVASNGLAGTSAASLTVTAQVAAFDTGAIKADREVFGFDETAKLVANTTNTGPSGAYSPVQIALTNSVIAY